MGEETKKCPQCAEEIKLEAKVCRYCEAEFELIEKGYCKNCKEVVELDEVGKCKKCGSEVLEKHTKSVLLEKPKEKVAIASGYKSAGPPPPPSGPPPSPPSEKLARHPGCLVWVIFAHAVISLTCLLVLVLIPAIDPSYKGATISETMTIAAIIFLVAALFGFTAWGVFKKKRWGRILLIVTMALFWLPAFPIGTLLAIYVIYSLFKNPNWIVYFEQI